MYRHILTHYIYTHIHMCICIYHTHIRMYVCVYVYTHTHIYVYILFKILFHYSLLQEADHSYTVNPLLSICFVYGRVHLLSPYSQRIPPPLPLW